MPHILREGLYLVKNRDENLYLGEATEKKPMAGVPRKVEGMPPGVRAPQWHLDKRDNGRWIITNEGCPAFPMDGKVYALPMPHDSAFGWDIQPAPQVGPNFYTVRDPENVTTGWALRGTAYTQVEIVPFIMDTPREHHDTLYHHASGGMPTPFYPKGALFQLVPVPQDAADV